MQRAHGAADIAKLGRVLAATLVVALMGPLSAQASARRYVVPGVVNHRMELLSGPSEWLPEYVPTLGTAITFTHLHWTGWGTARATATGQASVELNLGKRGGHGAITIALTAAFPRHGVEYYCLLVIPKLPPFLAGEGGFQVGVAVDFGQPPCGTLDPS